MRRLILLGVLGAVVLLLVLAQLFLPSIAAQRIRDRLSQHGTVERVEVDAFPAIELLWHHADKVVVRMGAYRSQSAAGLSGTLDPVGDVDTLEASAATVTAGLLTLRDATLTKRGNRLTGSARVTNSDLRASLPILTSVQPVATGGGGLTLRGTATVLGVTGSVDATVAAVNGQVVVTPDVPFGGLATVTVFADPRIEVESVTGTATPDGFSATASAHLR